MGDYIHKWYEEERKNRTGGWTTYSPSSLKGCLYPYYETMKTNNAPFNETKLGRDLKNCPFVVKRRLNKGNVYDINWNWNSNEN